MPKSVFLYVPNIIGYCRVACTLASLALVGSNPVFFLSFYFVGFAADAVDGWVARKLGQTSRLGAVLDMVTDRCSTVGLLAVLCRLAPDRSFLWICLMLLDISSHWFQVYASAVRGEDSHKDSNSASFVVRLYYSNRMFMGFCCVSAEVILLCMFGICNTPLLEALGAAPAWAADASSFITGQCNPGMHPDVATVAVLFLCLPGCIVKQCINMYQLATAAQQIAELDEKAE